MHLMIHIDGGSRGNPGPAGAGVVIRSADDKTILFQAGYFLGRATNNIAEYRGLLEALRQAQRLKARKVDVYSDSELLVRQMNGQYRVKNAFLKPLFEQARRLAGEFQRFSIVHVYRQSNALADKLANQAMNVQANVEDAAES